MGGGRGGKSSGKGSTKSSIPTQIARTPDLVPQVVETAEDLTKKTSALLDRRRAIGLSNTRRIGLLGLQAEAGNTIKRDLGN